MTSNLDILDSAVKIAIGAFLGGYFTFATQAYIQNQTRDREKKKELRNRLFEITRKIAKSFETVTHYTSSAVAFNNHPKLLSAKLEYEEADKEHVVAWKALLSIPSELEILGLDNTSNLARTYFLQLSKAPDMVEEFITTNKETLRNSMNTTFDALMTSIKNDYHSLF